MKYSVFAPCTGFLDCMGLTFSLGITAAAVDSAQDWFFGAVSTSGPGYKQVIGTEYITMLKAQNSPTRTSALLF